MANESTEQRSDFDAGVASARAKVDTFLRVRARGLYLLRSQQARAQADALVYVADLLAKELPR